VNHHAVDLGAQNIGSPLLWASFLAGVALVLAVDLKVSSRKQTTFRESLYWSLFWIALSVAFGSFVWFRYGSEQGLEFLAGYLLEWSLSVDNLFVFVLLFRGFAIPSQTAGSFLMIEINIPEIVAEVTEAFMRYERALIANDIAELDALFWQSPHTLRYGIGENLYGYDAIAAFRSGRPLIDLTRRLMNTVITTYGRDTATVNTEFQRVGATASGRQSHVWLRTAVGWQVAAAHVSLLPPRTPST